MSEPGKELAAIGNDLRDLTGQIAGFRKSVHRRLIVQGVLLVIVVLVLIGGIFTAIRVASQTNCIGHWANATSARSNATVVLQTRRVDLLYKYLRTAASGVHLTSQQRSALVKHLESLRNQFPQIIPPPNKISQSSDTLLSAYNELIKGFQTNDRYAAVLQKHPLPASPSEACNYII